MTAVSGVTGVTVAEDSVTAVSVRVDKDYGPGGSRAVDDVAKRLKEKYPYYLVQTKDDRIALLEERVAWARQLYIITGSVALLIGLMFVVTIMVMSVYERTTEIGMMRAIGISRRTIAIQIVGQSAVLITIGSLLGIVLGYFSSRLISDYIRGQYGLSEELAEYTPELVAFPVLLVLLLGIGFSLYPAYRAVAVDIVRSIRHVQ